jgi:DNA polymerase alpha subunit A
VHPLVARLCGPIEGTDPARLADCLGLDSAKFHSTTHAVEESREDPFASAVTLDDETRFQVYFLILRMPVLLSIEGGTQRNHVMC